MEVTFDGFSIRDYTSKMRSVDVFKCWPFTTSRHVTSKDLQSWLPPMTLPTSLRCCSNNDQLRSKSIHHQHHDGDDDDDDGGGGDDDDAARTQPEENQPSREQEQEQEHQQEDEEEVSRSDDTESVKSDGSAAAAATATATAAAAAAAAAAEDEKLEMVCPVCRDFNAATLTAVNAHIDGCLAQTMRDQERRHMRRMMSFKSKSKAPKKRSIAEIFKVEEEQPQIETVLKFWPFGVKDHHPDDEVSISVTKFRWLSRRLEALRSNRVEGDGEISKKGNESGKSDRGDDSAVAEEKERQEEEEEEKLEMVCPVCRDFNAATVTAVNAHIDGCLAQAMREERGRQMRRTSSSKPKPKAPKKRSIAEILTVAPQIEASNSEVIEVEDEDNGEEEKSDYGAGGDSSGAVPTAAVVSTIKSKKSTNKNRKKKKMKKVKRKSNKVLKHSDGGVLGVMSFNNEKKMIMNKKRKEKKKKKKKKDFFNNVLTATKEDAYKHKLQTPVNSSRKLRDTIGNKMATLDDIDASVHKKKLDSIPVEKKQKVKNCDSVGKQQKAVSPVSGILKNHLKHVSGRTSSGCDIRDGTEEIHCHDQVLTSGRHVKFSGKDDILDPKRRDSFDESVFNLSSDVLATSLIKEQSSGSDGETASLEANRSYDYSAIDKDKRKEVCPIVESKQFSNTLEPVTVQNFLKPCTNQEKSKHLVEKSESLTRVAFCDINSLHAFDGSNTTTRHCSPYADISRTLSALEAAQMSDINTQVCEAGAFSSTGKFVDHLDGPTFQVTAMNSTANTRTFLEPSSSYSVSYNNSNERPEFPLQTFVDNDNSGQALGDRQLSHMFSADIIDNSFPLPGWAKGSARDNCLDQNFFGLPLNSHGELINFSSSGKIGMNQPETSSTLRGSLSALSVNNFVRQTSQENGSINERHIVQKTFPKDGLNPFAHYPARLAVSEIQCSERGDIHRPDSGMCSSHYVQLHNSELNFMRNPFNEQNQRDQVQNHKGKEMISLKESSDLISLSSSQPTVRLMGKDVSVGRSSKEMQQFVGDVWADEESRRRHYSEYVAFENSLVGRCSKQDWISGSPLQISTENVLHSAKIQSNQALQSTLLMNGPDSEFPQLFRDLQGDHVSQRGSLGVNSNASSYFHPITQASTSSAVFNRARDDFPEQFIPVTKPLGLSSPSQVLPTPCNFSQPTCLSNVELNDRKKHPHDTKSAFEFPFLHPVVDEHAKTSWFQRSYRSLPSCLLSSTDERLPGTFGQQFSGLISKSFPQNICGNNFTTPSVNHSAEVLYPPHPLTSHCPASVVQPPHVPVIPSTINSGCRNIIKVSDGVNLDDVTTKDHHPCTNARKRPAANLDDTRKPVKLPNMEVQENLIRLTGLTRENKVQNCNETLRSRT